VLTTLPPSYLEIQGFFTSWNLKGFSMPVKGQLINLWSVLGINYIRRMYRYDLCCTFTWKCIIKYWNTKANQSNFVRTVGCVKVLLSVPVRVSFLFATFLKICLAPISIITCINAPQSIKKCLLFLSDFKQNKNIYTTISESVLF